MMVFNCHNQVMGVIPIGLGGINGVICDQRIIFQVALKSNCVGFILIHNHPSGSLKPSQDDKKLTSEVGKGAKIHNLKLLDHLIISREGFYSFANDGEL